MTQNKKGNNHKFIHCYVYNIYIGKCTLVIALFAIIHINCIYHM